MREQPLVYFLLQLRDVWFSSEFIDCGQASVLDIDETVFDDFFVVLCDIEGSRSACSSPVIG